MKNTLLIFLSALLLSACASGTASMSERHINELTEELESVKAEMQALQRTVLDNSMRLGGVDPTESTPEPPVEEQMPEVVHMQTESAEQAQNNEEVETMPEPVEASQASEIIVPSPSVEQVQPPVEVAYVPTVSQQTPVPTPTTVAGFTENEAYQAALNLYRTGRFDSSISAFNTFLQTYPSSSLASNALYWKGESYYAKAEYNESILVFKDILARFPTSYKAADALLKIALAYQKLGDNSNSALHTSVLYEDWPQSEAATKARELNLQPI